MNGGTRTITPRTPPPSHIPPTGGAPRPSLPSTPMDGGPSMDSGPSMSLSDAGVDSGAALTCDPARCPVSDVRLAALHYTTGDLYAQRPCCIGADPEDPWHGPP